MAGIFLLVALVAILYLLFSANGPFVNSPIAQMIKAIFSGNTTREVGFAITAALEAINSGSSNINFVLDECPLVVKDGERVLAVLPNTALLEPQTIRVRHGNRHHSSFGMGYRYRSSWGSSSYTQSLHLTKKFDKLTLAP